jgi:hypothetical protein
VSEAQWFDDTDMVQHIKALPDEALMRPSPVEALLDLMEGWEIVDSRVEAFTIIFAARHADGRWAVARVRYLHEFPDLLPHHDDSDDRFYTYVDWDHATAEQRKTMLLDTNLNAWVDAPDLLDLWQRLLRAENAYQYGDTTRTPGDPEWYEWMAVGFWLTWQHEEGHRLRAEPSTGLLLSLRARDSDDEAARTWSQADMVLFGCIWDWCFAAVGHVMMDHADGAPVPFPRVQAVNSVVYSQIKQDHFPHLQDASLSMRERDAHRAGTTPPERPDHLPRYLTKTEMEAAVDTVMATLDWEAIPNDAYGPLDND